MALTLLHTAQVHVDTFDRLRDRIAPGTQLNHMVHPELLEAALKSGVTPEIEARLAALLSRAPGRIICTCTTLGEAAARHGAIRIDQPMMRAAARSGGRVLTAYALTSTLAPSRALFLAEGGAADDLDLLDLTALWPLFQMGQTGAFHDAIADAVRQTVDGHAAVVLAQASMAGAADALADLGTPVLTSPEMALRAALAH